jgi:antitoxin (DNA-binding transcriptional repressor) of toxin-antitoxin stability system
MKTATIRQVRHDLSSLLAWVREGNDIVILNRARPVARLCPLVSNTPDGKITMPDFAARAKTIFGDRRPARVNPVLAEREQSRW